MPGYLQLAQVARAAHARLRTARELEARWKALPPEQQDATRADWEAMKHALVAVRDRVTAGPRGFAQGFGAAYRGDDDAPTVDARPLREIVPELHRATERLRRSLEVATAQADEPDGADPRTARPGGGSAAIGDGEA